MKKSHLFKIMIFLIIVLSISTVTYSLVTNSMNEEKNISKLINVAGRERMLAERMNRKALEIVYLEEATREKQELQEAVGEFEVMLHSLQYGNNELKLIKLDDEEFQAHLSHVESIWELLKDDLEQIIYQNSNASILINQINSNTADLINHLEIAVQLAEEKGSQRVEGLNTEILILILLNLLVVIVLFVTWRLLSRLWQSEKRYSLFVEHSPLGILTLKENEVVFINKFALQTLGYKDEKDVLGKTLEFFVHEDDQKTVSDSLRQVQNEGKKADSMEQKWLKANGDVLYVEVISIPLQNIDEKTSITIFTDITERIISGDEAERNYRELKNLKTALDMSYIVEITDENGVIKYVNDKSLQMNKCKKEDLIGNTHQVMSSGYHSKEFYQHIWETIKSGRVWEGDVKNRAKDGSMYWLKTTIIPFINQDGKPYQYLTIRTDITQQKNVEKEIERLATKDELTNLANRRVFGLKLAEAVLAKEPFAVIYLDLDRFKYVNDTLGHAIGDLLLIDVAKRLKKIVPSTDVISRQGGDEFSILAKISDRKQLATLCQRILDDVKEPYFIENREIIITCSIGISVYPEDGSTSEQLMKNADLAMYESKSQGRASFVFYNEYMSLESERTLDLEKKLRKAVENKELELYYQPKLHLKTNTITGTEALLCWNHPQFGGDVTSSEVISLAEETSLMDELGEWVLRTACIQNKKWQDAGFSNLRIAVNVSVLQFKNKTIVPIVKKVLKETGMAAKFLELEITGSEMDYEELREQFVELTALGVHLILDKFATGDSSLKFLKDFPMIDSLKIDQTFISDNENALNNSQLMVGAIISLAKALNMKVEAVGIETKEQKENLMKKDCDYGQGNGICEPLPAEKIIHRLSMDGSRASV